MKIFEVVFCSLSGLVFFVFLEDGGSEVDICALGVSVSKISDIILNSVGFSKSVLCPSILPDNTERNSALNIFVDGLKKSVDAAFLVW
ncbi:MAG TPA: hypothetical protein EYN67_09950 [Flavobacteriales bacterium]|nr:hypothetical protein [Flavobacteriales bacterium]